jgi:uracil-DNA glycosylase
MEESNVLPEDDITPWCEKEMRYAEGPETATAMLVGQNPGREEVKQGRPFVGRSGKYLNKVLKDCGLTREQLYITPLVKEPTPGNRKPTAAEIKYWIPCLEREIKNINPRIIVLMGRVAWHAPRLEGIGYIETYHPAAAMRFPEIRARFETDIRTLAGQLKCGGGRGRTHSPD